MKLYFYYLKENKLQKDVAAGIRENKYDYAIHVQNKSKLGSLREWRLRKSYCDIVQVDDSLYPLSPFVISAKDNLESVPNLEEMLVSVLNSCSSINENIKSFSGDGQQ